mmetsp:Transcript_49379/g.143151  ORF Transcript_49379/g.143151 Transcript_49379/m.143151 type:complete len:255 (+) Transcript_49379:56-820(+)
MSFSGMVEASKPAPASEHAALAPSSPGRAESGGGRSSDALASARGSATLGVHRLSSHLLSSSLGGTISSPNASGSSVHKGTGSTSRGAASGAAELAQLPAASSALAAATGDASASGAAGHGNTQRSLAAALLRGTSEVPGSASGAAGLAQLRAASSAPAAATGDAAASGAASAGGPGDAGLGGSSDKAGPAGTGLSTDAVCAVSKSDGADASGKADAPFAISTSKPGGIPTSASIMASASELEGCAGARGTVAA